MWMFHKKKLDTTHEEGKETSHRLVGLVKKMASASFSAR